MASGITQTSCLQAGPLHVLGSVLRVTSLALCWEGASGLSLSHFCTPTVGRTGWKMPLTGLLVAPGYPDSCPSTALLPSGQAEGGPGDESGGEEELSHKQVGLTAGPVPRACDLPGGLHLNSDSLRISRPRLCRFNLLDSPKRPPWVEKLQQSGEG